MQGLTVLSALSRRIKFAEYGPIKASLPGNAGLPPKITG
jgi:hypothetical protein